MAFKLVFLSLYCYFVFFFPKIFLICNWWNSQMWNSQMWKLQIWRANCIFLLISVGLDGKLHSSRGHACLPLTQQIIKLFYECQTCARQSRQGEQNIFLNPYCGIYILVSFSSFFHQGLAKCLANSR